MKNRIVYVRDCVSRFLYKSIFKRIFFCIDPEIVHGRMVQLGRFLGSNVLMRTMVALLFSYKDERLEQKVLGITFQNPVGLSAGFDKNAQLTGILPSVGFGFMEVGSITGEPCEGNPLPRLWRLKKSRALVVYYGLVNEGCEKVAKRLCDKFFGISHTSVFKYF